MTWKQFKDAMEKEGVKDDDMIGYIDVGGEVKIKVTIKDSQDKTFKIVSVLGN